MERKTPIRKDIAGSNPVPDIYVRGGGIGRLRSPTKYNLTKLKEGYLQQHKIAFPSRRRRCESFFPHIWGDSLEVRTT